MTAREQILQEMVAVPEAILAEVLDFLRFLKAKQLQASPPITVVSPGGGVSSCRGSSATGGS